MSDNEKEHQAIDLVRTPPPTPPPPGDEAPWVAPTPGDRLKNVKEEGYTFGGVNQQIEYWRQRALGAEARSKVSSEELRSLKGRFEELKAARVKPDTLKIALGKARGFLVKVRDMPSQIDPTVAAKELAAAGIACIDAVINEAKKEKP